MTKQDIFLPNTLIEPSLRIIGWHLENYIPSLEIDILLKRIKDKIERHKRNNGIVLLEQKELYPLWECVSNATNNVSECGLDEETVWAIYEWVISEQKKQQ